MHLVQIYLKKKTPSQYISRKKMNLEKEQNFNIQLQPFSPLSNKIKIREKQGFIGSKKDISTDRIRHRN